jgi:DNA-binding transcriptional LysR family regulator
MEIQWLRYFVAVAEEASFTKASLRLGISQPPLSRHIQELEETIGAELFVRGLRHVELTAIGQVLLPEAKAAIAEFDHALEVARRSARGEIGLVTIAISGGLSETLEMVLTEHRKRAPDVTIEYRDMPSKEQNVALRQHEVDIGFLRAPVDNRLNSIFLFEEQLFVLLPPAHHLEKQRSIKLTDIANEPLLLPDPRRSKLYDKILELYEQAGVSPGPVGAFRGSLLSQAGQLQMRTEERLCFVARSALELSTCRTAIRLDEPGATYPVCVAWRKGEKDAAILVVLDSIRKTFKHGLHTTPRS